MLNRSERRSAVILLGLMFIGMLLETLGVGLVIPALALLTQGDLLQRYPRVHAALGRFGDASPEQLVVLGMGVLALVYAIKAAFLAFLAWRQMRFVYGLQAEISQRLFASYMRQRYTFHIERNSAQLVRNVYNEVNILTQNGVLQGLTLLAELLVVFGIFALLVYVEPLGALLAVATLGGLGFGYHRLTRSPVLRWGKARQLHEGLRMQHLQQGLSGVKDVKLLGREAEFIAQYQTHARGAARVSQRQATLLQLPRLALELLAVLALAVLVVTMIGQGRPLVQLLPTIGVFATAAFRIMPSANRIISAIQTVRYSLPVVHTLYDEMNASPPEQVVSRVSRLHFGRALTLDGVSFRYPGADTDSLSDVSLTVEANTSVGFIGGSGAGKSTLVDVILGLLLPDRGEIRVDDVDVQSDLRGWQNNIGYVPQQIYLTDDTLRRNIAFGLPDNQIDEQAVRRALRAAQLEDFALGLSQGLDTTVGERGVRLSGGQLQRIGIARALYHDPPVLVLDEATSALDTATERDVMDAVFTLKDKTVLIVAHRLSTVERCTRLYRLHQGRVVEDGTPGTMTSFRSRPDTVAARNVRES